MNGIRHYLLLFIIFCIILCVLFDVVEADKVGKIAKNVIKAGVMNTSMGKKSYGHGYKPRRGFPIWGIILLVLACSSILGLLIFLYCMFRRRQACWNPTSV